MFSYFIVTFLWLIMIMLCICTSSSISDIPDNMHLLDENPIDIYNKTLASKSTSTMRNYGASRTMRTPPTVEVPYISRYIPPTPPPIVGRSPEQTPNSRHSFTPPLPPEYNNPFAERPTLRGSNADNAVSNRRPAPPPPVRVPSDKERIPIKPPGLEPDTKKKSINTPSVQKLPDGLNYSEPSSSPTSTTHNINNTYDIVIPMVHNISFPSILRILDNGKKHDFLGNNKPHLEQELKPSKTFKDEILKAAIDSTTQKSTASITVKQEEENQKEISSFVFPQNNVIDVSINQDQDSTVKEHQVTEGRNEFHPPIKSMQETTEVATMPDHPEPRARYILGIAWDIHVYLIATLFAILACLAGFSLLRITAYKRLLPCSYFITVHGLLMLIGIVRSVYLFYNAYNISKLFSESVSRLMLNIVFPLLIAIFTSMFVFILKTIDVKVGFYYIQKTYTLLIFSTAYLVFSVMVDLYAGTTPYVKVLTLSSQGLFVISCVVLGVTYIYLYKYMSHAPLRKRSSVYGTAFADPMCLSLAHAIRVMLATSLLSLLMASIQLIGMFCIYEPFGRDQLHPWLWWAFQLSVRVIEVSMCFLVFWAAVQPLRSEDEKETQSHNSASGFALFSWGAATPRGSDNGNADDIYPTICSTNQAIHNYSLRTGKQVYEDIFPLNNIHSSSTVVPPHLLSHTTERRSVKKHPPDCDMNMGRCGGTLVSSYSDRRPQPSSSSMLVDEKGIVRFRSFAETEPQSPEELFPHRHNILHSHSSEEYST